MKNLICGAMAIALSANGASAAEKAPVVPKEASFYVQCDGSPDNMSGGETALRVLALSAVVGLLAPPPEAADAAKRKFGAAGVAACDAVLSGDKAESNVERRLKLLSGRAIHRIEAKDHAGAIADMAAARGEARAAGLMDDVYFRRSKGLSFDQIEAAALFRQRKFAEANAVSTAGVREAGHALASLVTIANFGRYDGSGLASELELQDRTARLLPTLLTSRAARMQELRRFDDAAKLTEDWVQYDLSFKPIAKEGEFQQSSWALANAALAHALAGRWEAAAKRANEARTNDAARTDAGKPDPNRAAMAELLDLYEVLRLAHDGNAAGARRMFTGRSEWTAPSLGAVLETNRLLRSGAPSADLVNALAKTADEMLAAKREAGYAQTVAKDSDNATLFRMMTPYVRASAFEAMSGKVWKLDKSKILLKKLKESDFQQVAFLYQTAGNVRYDAILLHAALMARKDGFKGVLFIPIQSSYGSVAIRMGNPGDVHMPASLYIDAETAIAALSPIIPDPVTLKARKTAAK